MLAAHKALLVTISKALMRNGSLDASKIAALAKPFGHIIGVHCEGHLETPGYEQKLLEA